MTIQEQKTIQDKGEEKFIHVNKIILSPEEKKEAKRAKDKERWYKVTKYNTVNKGILSPEQKLRKCDMEKIRMKNPENILRKKLTDKIRYEKDY